MGERPLECSGCKRQAKITYKEIVGKRIQIVSCCDHCPILKEKIRSEETNAFFPFQNMQEKINCPNCKLTYEEFVMGSLLGCSTCYEVFEESLIEELTSSDAIALSDPAQYMHKKKMSLHMGKIPEIKSDRERRQKLESLNTALSDALNHERYEEAASIRDQIQTLVERRLGQ